MSKAEYNPEESQNYKILKSISRLVQSSRSGETQFDEVFELLSELVPLECASLFMYNEKEQKLHPVADSGERVDLASQFTFGNGKGKGLSSFVAEHKRPLHLPDLHNGPRFGEGVLRSFVSVPLLAGLRLVGVLNLGHYKAGVFSKNHLDLLEIVGSQLASIILQIEYARELEKKNDELEEINNTLMKTRDKLIEMEKMATLGHITVGVNHEINNPLAIISGHLQLLELEGDELPESVLEKVEIMMKEVDRISEVLLKLQRVKKIHLSKYTENGVKMIDLNESVR